MSARHSISFNRRTGVVYRTLGFLGFPQYRVGTDGSVWSKCRGRWERLKTHKIKKKSGYIRYVLGPGAKAFLAHRLVLLAFDGPCPPGMEARHFPDRCTANNALANLQWATRRTNYLDKKLHGTEYNGVKHHRCKTTEETVRAIRRDHAELGIGNKRLARKYGMDPGTVSNIISRRSWKHLS